MALYRPVNVWNFARTSILDVMISVSSGIVRNTSSPVSGSADMTITYPSGASVTWTLSASLNGFLAPSGFSSRKFSAAFPFKFTANPSNHVGITQIGGTWFYLSSNRKIMLGSTETSDAALSANTVYWLNIIVDRDWNFAGSGAFLARVYDSTFTTLLQSLTVNTNLTPSLTFFGETQLKATVGPATTLHIGSGMILYDDSASIKAPWVRNPTLQTFRVPTANGSNNDATGVSEATNKYLNVDENPNSATDYNHMGQIGVTEKQTFQYNTATYGGATVRAFAITQFRKLSGGQTVTGATKSLFVHSSTDYEINENASTQANATVRGGDKMPNGDSISETHLDNLRAGFSTNLSDTVYNSGQNFVGAPITDSTYNDFTTSGGGANRYAEVDDGAVTDNTNYIIGTTNGQKQGFTFNFNPTPAVLGDTIYKVVFRVTGRTNSSTTGTFCRMGVRISGNNYTTSNFLVDASTTAWSEDVVEFVVSGSHLNPATGNRWTVSDITGSIWFVEIVTMGTGDCYISNITLGFYGASRIMQESTWMDVLTGDAFTENGNVLYKDKSYGLNQAINRANTF